MKSGIYALARDSDGKRYIGQSVDVIDRIQTHIRLLSDDKHDNPKLQAAWNKGGSWTFEVLEACSRKRLNDVEQRHLDEAWPHVFNIIREVTMPPMRGKKMSEEHKRKISEANKGRVFSTETREKIAATKRGKSRSPETIAKATAARWGKRS